MLQRIKSAEWKPFLDLLPATATQAMGASPCQPKGARASGPRAFVGFDSTELIPPYSAPRNRKAAP